MLQFLILLFSSYHLSLFSSYFIKFYIYTEINTNTLYKDCALVSEIDEYLSKYGFIRVETSMTPFEWGDALYIKINKK